MLPPYRWLFDARAVDDVRAIGVDAACLRNKCDSDPRLGYQVMQRFLPVLAERLEGRRGRAAVSGSIPAVRRAPAGIVA